jgi:hypothetical protein
VTLLAADDHSPERTRRARSDYHRPPSAIDPNQIVAT